MRVCTLLFALAIVASALSTAYCAPPQYVVTDLGTLGGDSTYASHVNEDGRVVGASYPEGQGWHGFVWDSTGGLTDLGTLGGPESQAKSVNSYGQIVGHSYIAGSTGTQHAVMWDASGAIHDLGILDDDTISHAYDISDAGQVVGFSGSRGFIWDQERGMRSLGERYCSYATSINECGQVTGHSGNHAFLYDPAVGLLDIHDPTVAAYSYGWGVNKKGQVVGNLDITSDPDHAFVWDSLGGMQDIGDFANIDASAAWAINDQGQIVGHFRYTPTSATRACLWDSGRLRDLNELVLPDSGWELQNAASINERGQIVGFGRYEGEMRAFLLTPVPEPSGLLALAAGAIPLFGRARFRIRCGDARR